MNTLYLILYILAGASFLAAVVASVRPVRGTGTATSVGMNLVALGLLFWVLVPLIAQAKSLN